MTAPALIVDDAGFGCPVGSMLIGGYRPATAEFAVREVPIECFQSPLFERKGYHQGALDATKLVLADLAARDDEFIEICQGEPHHGTHAWLAATNRPHRLAHIVGPMQGLIEDALKEYLHRLGFHYRGSTEQYGLLFYKSVEFLKDGDLNRRGMNPEKLKLAKSGWAAFAFYRDLPYNQAKAASKQMMARL